MVENVEAGLDLGKSDGEQAAACLLLTEDTLKAMLQEAAKMAIIDGTKPTNTIITRDTVDELREDISKRFPDKLPFARYKEDHKSVVESWI